MTLQSREGKEEKKRKHRDDEDEKRKKKKKKKKHSEDEEDSTSPKVSYGNTHSVNIIVVLVTCNLLNAYGFVEPHDRNK